MTDAANKSIQPSSDLNEKQIEENCKESAGNSEFVSEIKDKLKTWATNFGWTTGKYSVFGRMKLK